MGSTRVRGSAANSFELMEGGGRETRCGPPSQQAWKCIRAKYASGAAGLVPFQVEADRLIKKGGWVLLVRNSTQRKVKIYFFAREI